MSRPLVLFVCTGNICRSPMAEGIARDLGVDGGLEFASAGTHAIEGAAATANSVRVAAEIGVDISAHSAQLATGDLVSRANRIYGLAGEHVDWLAARFPDVNVEFLDPLGGDIEDPYGMEMEDYRVARLRIVDAILARRGEWA